MNETTREKLKQANRNIAKKFGIDFEPVEPIGDNDSFETLTLRKEDEEWYIFCCQIEDINHVIPVHIDGPANAIRFYDPIRKSFRSFSIDEYIHTPNMSPMLRWVTEILKDNIKPKTEHSYPAPVYDRETDFEFVEKLLMARKAGQRAASDLMMKKKEHYEKANKV